MRGFEPLRHEVPTPDEHLATGTLYTPFTFLRGLSRGDILYFNMNPDKNTRLFILMLAAGLLLVGTTVFVQGQSIMKMQKSLSKIADSLDGAEYGPPPNIEQNDCVLSGGEYKNGTCECGKDYFLEFGQCMGQDGLTEKELEEIKANQERLMQQSANGPESAPNITRADCIATGGEYKNDECTCGNGYVLEGSQCVDSDLFIEFGNVSARMPDGWETRLISRDTTRAQWRIVDKASGQERGDVICPIGGAGFEGWNFNESLRTYQRGNTGLYAKKLIGEPLERNGLNWLAMIWAGSTKADTWDLDPACVMTFAVSNPPTQKELLRIDMVYRSIK